MARRYGVRLGWTLQLVPGATHNIRDVAEMATLIIRRDADQAKRGAR
jgi:hypothetical protein